jgi:hypothetical protein
MALQFEVEAPREMLLIPPELASRAWASFTLVEQDRDLAAGTGGPNDEPLAVDLQHLFVEAGFVVEPFQLRDAGQLKEVLI